MTQEGGYLLVSTKIFLEGCTDRFDFLSFRPDKEGHVLFLLSTSNDVMLVNSLYQYFSIKKYVKF